MRRKDYAIVLATALALVGGYFVVLTPGEAQEPPAPPNLFTPVVIPDWVDPLLPDDTSILRSRPVSVNFDILTAAQPPEPGADPPTVPIRFNLFDDVSVTVIFHRARPRYDIEIPENPMDLLGQEFEPVGYNWLGNIVGDVEGHVILATAPNVCAVEISAPDLGTFIVRSFGDVHVVRELSGGDWECGVVATEDSSGQGAAPEAGGVCGIDFVGCDDGSVLDLLIVYTSAARIEAENKGKDIEMEIKDFHFTDANLALSNSQVNTEFRLVGVIEVDYSGSVNQAKIVDPWDGILDEIHALRNALRADLVSVAVAASQGFGGSNGMGDEAPWRERLAFNHYLWSRGGADYYYLTHETGHNLGCAHNRQALCPCDGCPGCSQQTCIQTCPNCENNCDCDHGPCDYSYGYLLPPEAPLYDTVMSWPAPEPGGSDTILYFSNPNVYYKDYQTGEAPPSCDSADNAGTIDETRDTVANYRESCDTTDTTNIASRDYFEGQADADSSAVSISDNGQYIAFASDATTGWIQGGQDLFSDIYLFNRESGLVTVMSRHSGSGGGDSSSPVVSGDGRFIAFASEAQNLSLVGANPNGAADIYAYDQGQYPFLKRISLSSEEAFASGNSDSPSISRNGRYVAFESDAGNLLDGPGQIPDTNIFSDIFVRDRDGNEDLSFDDPADSETARVSISTASAEANGHSRAPSISADGRYVAFESDATNLVEDDTNIHSDIFLRDTDLQLTSRVSVSVDPFNPDPNGPSFAPSISADGRFVLFESDATNLVDGDNNNYRDIFLRDTQQALTFRISDLPGPEEANGDSYGAVISADRRYVAFYSYADNLVPNDNNGQPDVFVYHLNSGDITRASVNSASGEALGGGSFAPAISQNGRFVAFESDATNLVPADVGGYMDVFFRDRGGTCVGDLNGDSVVDAFDLAILLGAWGPYGKCPPYLVADLDQNCDVGAFDLAILLGNWGMCL